RGGRLTEIARRYRLRWGWLGVGGLLPPRIAPTMELGMFPFGVLALYSPVLPPPDFPPVRPPPRGVLTAPAQRTPVPLPSTPNDARSSGHGREQEPTSFRS